MRSFAIGFATACMFLVILYGAGLYKANQRTNIYRDSLYTYKLSDSTNLYKISQLEMGIDEAHKELGESKSLIKELESKVGHIKTITKIKTVTQVDTLVLRDTIIDSAVMKHYEDQYISLRLKLDTISNLKIHTNLTVGESDQGFWVRSDNPYFHINQIKSIKNPQKPLSFNYGFGMALGYDLLSRKVYLGPGVYVGLNYKF